MVLAVPAGSDHGPLDANDGQLFDSPRQPHGRSQRRTAGHQHPEPRLLIDQFLLQGQAQHLKSERY